MLFTPRFWFQVRSPPLVNLVLFWFNFHETFRARKTTTKSYCYLNFIKVSQIHEVSSRKGVHEDEKGSLKMMSLSFRFLKRFDRNQADSRCYSRIDYGLRFAPPACLPACSGTPVKASEPSAAIAGAGGDREAFSI